MEDMTMSHLSPLKKFLIIMYKIFFRFVYNTASMLLKHDERKAVLVLYRTKTLEGNLKFIHDELKRQIPDIKIHLVYPENKMNLKMFTEAITISNARYLIIDDYYLPVYLIKPKKNLKVIQLWHAAGAFKKFGYSTIGTKFGPDKEYLKLVPIHSNYTHVYVSARKFIKFYAEAFNMDENKIFPIGVPRTDMFYKKQLSSKYKIQRCYPKLEKNVNILFAPTYRAEGSQSETTLNFLDLLIKIQDKTKDNVKLIIKPHPYMNDNELNILVNYSKIIVAKEYSVNDWMLVSDAFITDYSSSVFEFALLKKPIAHFVPDLNEYILNRGLYLELSEVSNGEIIKEENTLIEWINEREKNEYFDTSRMVDFNFDNVNHVSKRVVEHFISS